MKNKEIKNIFESANVGQVLVNESMKKHTSFEIGGPVDFMILPESEEEIVNAVKLCREKQINYFVMGNGSNLLVRDGGFRGVIIKIQDNYNKIEVKDKVLSCQAGALLKTVSRRAQEASLTGLEFANGIPGAVGGAVTMNAGAYDGEMKNVVSKVRALDKNNQIQEFDNEQMHFAYRGSRVTEEGLIVLSVEFLLEEGDREKIREKVREFSYLRTSKQPLEMPSGGSTFKRPEGYYAGKLIDDAGLRGKKYGGAQVSEKHCGFVVNHDQASCADVLGLIGHIQDTVKEKYGVELEREIRIIGEDLDETRG